MSILPKPTTSPLIARPSREAVPRRLIVTAGVVAFAIRDWSLWVLLRSGPWGPPMRLVLGTEAVSDSVERTLDALLMWSERASLCILKAGWQEQQVQVWGSEEQGTAVSLMHTVLLRANRDRLRPNLEEQPVPSLQVKWVAVSDIESGRYQIDKDVLPGVLSALHTLRSYIEREPEIILRYLADMGKMSKVVSDQEGKSHDTRYRGAKAKKETMPLNMLREPMSGDGVLTLAEASLLYRAFFPPDEQIDLSNLRKRFLSTNKLQALNEERPVRGCETEWRRVGRAYRYVI